MVPKRSHLATCRMHKVARYLLKRPTPWYIYLCHRVCNFIRLLMIHPFETYLISCRPFIHHNTFSSWSISYQTLIYAILVCQAHKINSLGTSDMIYNRKPSAPTELSSDPCKRSCHKHSYDGSCTLVKLHQGERAGVTTAQG